MPNYRISVKTPMNSAGYHIEPGMFVTINTIFPVGGVGSMIADKIQAAFLSKYGVDLKKMNCCNAGYLHLDRI